MKTLASFVGGLFVGMAILVCMILVNEEHKKNTEVRIDLPEEFMYVVSDNELKPDTVLAFQSLDNDSLIIRFKP